MTEPLIGALARVARAEEHLGTLNEAVDGWGDKKRAALSGDKNPEGTDYSFYVNFDPLPDVVRWALLIGDCVHSLRAALDNAVYECSGSTPPGGCEFPVFLSRRYFDLPETDRRGYLYKVRGVRHDVVRTIIERAQPWNDQGRPDTHPLWVLHQLDIQDKHRLLTPVAVVPRGTNLGINIEYFEVGDHPVVEVSGPEWVPFKNHAEIVTLHVGERAKRVKMDVTFTFSIGLLVGDSSRPLLTTLRKASEYTRGLIEEIRDALI
jgi:hypothetical protein